MAIIEAFLIVILLLVSLYYLKNRIIRSKTPTNWPLFGMLPALVRNAHRVHEFATDILIKCDGTFLLKGPWFADSDMLVTSDPSNVHHVMSKNFSIYPKGDDFREKLDIMGDGVLNADSELWKIHRRTTMALMSNSTFYQLLEKTTWNKVETGLLPFLDYFSEKEAELDMQDLFQRFSFDSISNLLLDHDPGSLSIHLPHVPCKNAFNDALVALLYRHILPKTIWKLQRRLQIGEERKLSQAWQAIDDFIYPCFSKKQKEEDRNLLTAFFKAFDGITGTSGNPKTFMRDTLLSLLFAGTDTTSIALSWLFWLLAKNPSAEAKVLEEIQTKLHVKEDKKWRFFSVEESRELVYLHAALSESLRLYPPVSLQQKTSTQSDVLPSGHRIHPNTKVVMSYYSMGRMETVWGNDCLEFKPERWISELGGIKHQPSYKFPAFNAGPRTCLGKEMSFIQMKMIASTIIYHYRVEVVEGHPVIPSDALVIHMKHGLKVKLKRRDVS